MCVWRQHLNITSLDLPLPPTSLLFSWRLLIYFRLFLISIATKLQAYSQTINQWSQNRQPIAVSNTMNQTIEPGQWKNFLSVFYIISILNTDYDVLSSAADKISLTYYITNKNDWRWISTQEQNGLKGTRIIPCFDWLFCLLLFCVYFFYVPVRKKGWNVFNFLFR